MERGSVNNGSLVAFSYRSRKSPGAHDSKTIPHMKPHIIKKKPRGTPQNVVHKTHTKLLKNLNLKPYTLNPKP